MTTPYNTIYILFKDRVARDSKFYIKNNSPEIVNQFAKKRMEKLLNQAIYYLYVYDSKDKSDFEIDFYDKDDSLEQFHIELNDIELQLLADIMFNRYVHEQTIEKLNALRNIGFKDDELVQFSPANTLKEFNSTMENLDMDTNKRIKAYKSRKRDTGKYKSFNYNFD